MDVYSKFLVCCVKPGKPIPSEIQTVLLLYYLVPNDILERLLVRGLIEHHQLVFDRFLDDQIQVFMREEFSEAFLQVGLQSYFDEDVFISMMNIKPAVLDSLIRPPKKK